MQLWFQPFFDGSSWDGPAWSISAEWLAYLLFGGLVLIIFRIAPATRARGLIWLAVAAAVAPMLLLLTDRPVLHPVELATADRHAVHRGCAGLRGGAQTRSSPTGAGKRRADVAAARRCHRRRGVPSSTRYPPGDMLDAGGLVDVLFVPLVITLSIGAGTLPALLSTRVLVYLGHISFGLYMVHEIVHTAWNWAVLQFDIVLTPSWSAKFIVVGLIVLAGVLAALLYHLVEEPARRWMRRMVEPKGPADARSADPPGQAAIGGHARRITVLHARRVGPVGCAADPRLVRCFGC